MRAAIYSGARRAISTIARDTPSRSLRGLPSWKMIKPTRNTRNIGENVMNMEQTRQIVCDAELGKVNDQLMQ